MRRQCGRGVYEKLWQPLLDDLERELGLPVEPIFGSNYSVLVEAMRANQAQIGWFSALPAVQAIDRSNGEVIARTVDVGGRFERLREYPLGDLFAHVAGYFSFTFGTTGHSGNLLMLRSMSA